MVIKKFNIWTIRVKNIGKNVEYIPMPLVLIVELLKPFISKYQLYSFIISTFNTYPVTCLIVIFHIYIIPSKY